MEHTCARELQDRICSVLNADETLVKGGCKAIAEDSLELFAAVEEALVQRRGVAIVVGLGVITRTGNGPGAEAVDFPLEIHCRELPALREDRRRANRNALTALDAAMRAAAVLETEAVQWQRIEQTADDATGALDATAYFDLTATFTPSATPFAQEPADA